MGKEEKNYIQEKIKSIIIDIIHTDLLFLVIFLPLIFILVATELSVKFAYLLSSRIYIEYAFLSLFLIIIIKFISYFFGKYGSAYKLAFILLVRDNILDEQQVFSCVETALIAGSTMYIIVIANLLILFINTPLVVSKIVVGIIVALLLVYVLSNNKYENVASLIKKMEDES